jgi:DNA-binding transcriptional MerR regulator
MELITTKQTAEILGCSIQTISKMVRKGLLNPINPQKNYCLFDNDEIQRLFEFRKLNDIRYFTGEDKKSKMIRARM